MVKFGAHIQHVRESLKRQGVDAVLVNYAKLKKLAKVDEDSKRGADAAGVAGSESNAGESFKEVWMANLNAHEAFVTKYLKEFWRYVWSLVPVPAGEEYRGVQPSQLLELVVCVSQKETSSDFNQRVPADLLLRLTTLRLVCDVNIEALRKSVKKYDKKRSGSALQSSVLLPCLFALPVLNLASTCDLYKGIIAVALTRCAARKMSSGIGQDAAGMEKDADDRGANAGDTIISFSEGLTSDGETGVSGSDGDVSPVRTQLREGP